MSENLIKHITLPDGSVYDLADSYARSQLSDLDYSKVTLSAGNVSSTISNLVINNVTKSEYDAMLSEGTLCSDQLYSIDSLQLDARDDWVVNVKTPELSSDAANKAYVDSQLSNASGGGYAFDIYYPPFDSNNNMYVLKPGKFNYLSGYVTDGCILVLENYDENQIYKVKLSSDLNNIAHIGLLVDENSSTETPGAYSVAKLNGKIDWLAPAQIYVFEVSYGNVTINNDYNGDALVVAKCFETVGEPIDQYTPGETFYHLLPVDNAVNYLSALPGNRTYNLHMPSRQTVNGIRRMRQFKLVPSSAGFGENGAKLSILLQDIAGKAVTFRYKTDRAHAIAPLSGEALVFKENKENTFDVYYENELELDSTKIAAINQIAEERATQIKFSDGTVSSFAWSGRVSLQTMRNAGLYVTVTDEYSGDSWDEWPNPLISVKLGSAVTRIGDSLFYDCSSLSSVTIPEGVDKINQNSFSYCYSLFSLTIPSSVSVVEQDAFEACDNLTSIIVIGKTQAQAETLLEHAGLPNGCVISTYNVASKEWVEEQIRRLEQMIGS